MSRPTKSQLLHSYRHLYRGLLHAVQYAKPQRYTARDQLREAFRKGHPLAFDSDKVDRTLQFLKHAAQDTGLEHKILKNLLHTEWARQNARVDDIRKKKSPVQLKDKRDSRRHYDMTLAMLNNSMGLCLR